MHTTGSCFCGAIEWKADIDVNLVAVCHCRDCQIFSGSAFRLAGGGPKDFAFTKGAPRFFDKTADSGNIRRMAFCGDCGTALFFESKEMEGLVDVTVASFDEPEALAPAMHIWDRHRLGWLDSRAGLPRHSELPPTE